MRILKLRFCLRTCNEAREDCKDRAASAWIPSVTKHSPCFGFVAQKSEVEKSLGEANLHLAIPSSSFSLWLGRMGSSTFHLPHSSLVGRILTPASIPFVAKGPVPFRFHSSKTPVDISHGAREASQRLGSLRFCTSGTPRTKSSKLSVSGFALKTENVK